MPEAIPSIIAPYLQDCFDDTSLVLVTSTLSTPANWLLIRLLYAALSRTRNGDHGQDSSPSQYDLQKVIFVSLLRPSSQWLELGKKLGIDLASRAKSGRLLSVDGLAANVQGSIANSLHTAVPKSLQLDDIAATVHAQLQTAATPSHSAIHPTTVIFDGLDFVLASQLDVDMVKMQQFISSIRSIASAVILTCSADSPLLHNRHEGAAPLEREHGALAISLAHQSSWVFQLRGLDTGAAKDVTGVVRISRGGAYDDEERQTTLEDGEWLYQLKGDGSVRVWLRGQ